MLYIERRERIIQMLSEQRSITNLILAQCFKVTLNTIRSDVEALIDAGAPISKIHGGIVFQSRDRVSSIDRRLSSQIQEKKIIADLVLEHLPIDSNLSLFFDSSSTNLEIARILHKYPNHVTVITNFVDLASITGQHTPQITTILCGGTWWDIEHTTIGSATNEELRKYNPTIALLGASGLHIEQGIFNGQMETNELKKIMASQAKEVWLVCDHTKWGATVLTSLFKFDQIDVLVTDKKPSHEWLAMFHGKKIRVIYPR